MRAERADRRAVVLVSGGLDSATVLAIARGAGFACHALSFDYGQRHRAELSAAARVAGALGAVDHRVVGIDLRAIGGSALTGDASVPEGGASGPREIPITYVPARNMTFLSVAVGFAEVIGAGDIFLGVNAVDYSGYPDCRPEFLEAFAVAAARGTRLGTEGGEFRFRAPLIRMSKAEIIREGVRLGVDFAMTHSCYDPDATGAACGRCDSCRIRRRGFEEAGVADPTRYAAG
ncbi:MAG: 7-cyano-7-deazaguanine synthase QueC [Phycisphaerales bacterium]|nr:7-cyano-7-deazaguanine synthase QueC [Phycisphaerales bacterium]